MDFLGLANEFKRDHPHNYWAQLILIAFSAVFIALAVADLVEATPVQSTFNETDFNYPYSLSRESATHTKDDYLVVTIIPDGDSLGIAYRERGGSWEYQTIHDTGNAGSYRSGGVLNTLNNSVVVLASYITATYHEVHMWVKYPADGWDTWTDVAVYSGAGGRWACSMAINDTERILIMTTLTTSTYNLYYWIYDFDTMTKETGGTSGVNTGHATTNSRTVQSLANVTGKFHYFFNSGTGHWWRDIDTTIALTQVGPANFYFSMVQCLVNDRFIAAGHYSNTGRPYIYYQPTHMATTWTRVYIEAATRSYEYSAMGISLKQNSTFVTLISYCNTDEALTKWGAQWNANDTTWENSQTDTGVTDTDDIACIGQFGALWPIHPTTDIRWTRPSAGWAVLGRDENGTNDELDMISDGVNWTVDLTTADPWIVDTSLPSAVYGVFYSHTLTKANGTAPHVWSLLIKPSWMSIGAVNGTIYGTPDGTGTEQVKARLADAVPRYDEVQWTLTISASSEGEGAGDGIWGDMWLSGENCSSAGVLLLIILFALGIMGIVGSWER